MPPQYFRIVVTVGAPSLLLSSIYSAFSSVCADFTTMAPFYVMKRSGKRESVHFDKITSRVSKLCYGLDSKVRCVPCRNETVRCVVCLLAYPQPCFSLVHSTLTPW